MVHPIPLVGTQFVNTAKLLGEAGTQVIKSEAAGKAWTFAGQRVRGIGKGTARFVTGIVLGFVSPVTGKKDDGIARKASTELGIREKRAYKVGRDIGRLPVKAVAIVFQTTLGLTFALVGGTAFGLHKATEIGGEKRSSSSRNFSKQLLYVGKRALRASLAGAGSAVHVGLPQCLKDAEHFQNFSTWFIVGERNLTNISKMSRYQKTWVNEGFVSELFKSLRNVSGLSAGVTAYNRSCKEGEKLKKSASAEPAA